MTRRWLKSAGILVLTPLLVVALTGCDATRPQSVLSRNSPAPTPSTARVISPVAETSPVAITPLTVASVTPTATRYAPTTPFTVVTPLPTSVPVAPSTATATPAPRPTTPPPTATAVPTPTPTPQRVHIVRYGETLSIIAAKYGVTVTAIVRLNGLTNPNRIYPGQRLLIP